MHTPTHHRRQFLQGLAGLGLGAALPFDNPSFAADNKRILVVVGPTRANPGQGGSGTGPERALEAI